MKSPRSDKVIGWEVDKVTLSFSTIREISTRLSRGEFSAVDLLNHMFARIDSIDRDIGAFSDCTKATAKAEALASDKRRGSGGEFGPLDGIPIAVKDLIDTSPAVCSAGLAHLANYRPTTDAPVVSQLRGAGAVILGVTETDPGAFATSTARVINPLAESRLVGGSSGGSGAAVAAGLAFSALGTDTGGSIRIPAACCCVSGFKPTWGRVSTVGVRPLAISLDHVGPLARCVADLQLMQSIIDPQFKHIENETSLDSVVVGACEAYYADADPLIATAVRAVREVIKQAGPVEREIDLPHPDEVMSFHMVNLPREAADYHLKHFPLDWPNYPDIGRKTIELGSKISEEENAMAEQARNTVLQSVEDAFDKVDIILLPSMPIDTPIRGVDDYQLGGQTLSTLEATIRYTALFNQTGHPVVSLPAYSLADGRAISIQLVGRRHSDENLLSVARAIEGILDVQVDYRSLLKQQSFAKGSSFSMTKRNTTA